jgi:hypothetical protein
MLSFPLLCWYHFPLHFNNLTAYYVEPQINLLFLKIIGLLVWICSIENISSWIYWLDGIQICGFWWEPCAWNTLYSIIRRAEEGFWIWSEGCPTYQCLGTQFTILLFIITISAIWSLEPFNILTLRFLDSLEVFMLYGFIAYLISMLVISGILPINSLLYIFMQNKEIQ